VYAEPDDPDHSRLFVVLDLLSRFFLSYALTATLVPVSPSMPAATLDASWRTAINRAMAERLHFGSDVVFTYGPYGGVLDRGYEPGTRPLVLCAALVLAAGFVLATLIALRRTGPGLHLAAGLAVLLLAASILDGLVLLYPLLVVFAAAQLGGRSRRHLAVLVVLAIPLGLLPLTKLSLAPAAAVGLLGVALILIRRRCWAGLVVILATPILSLVGWWAVGHQAIGGLPGYVSSSWQIVAGYAEAMSLHDASRLPPGTATGLYILLAGGLIATAAATARKRPDGAVLTVAVFATLFLVFKAGFVRADHHMEMGVLALLATAALVIVGSDVRSVLRRTLAAVVVFGASLLYLATTPIDPVAALEAYTVRPVADVFNGDVTTTALDRRYADTMTHIRKLAPLPSIDGRADLYTSSLTLLLAQEGHWSPRPVIQSYSAYTPRLARMNEEHLLSSEAPATLFYKVDPIDGRLAALEDGASWRTLLQDYDVVSRASGYLVLNRRPMPMKMTIGTTSLSHARLGEPVTIPPTPGVWLASFDVRPTAVGRIRTALWKPPQLRVQIRTADGRTVVRRFVAAMARTEFVLSPYVGNTRDLGALLSREPNPAREVTSVTVRLEDARTPGAAMCWRSAYSLRLRSLTPHG
jgi:hypothetical protein